MELFCVTPLTIFAKSPTVDFRLDSIYSFVLFFVILAVLKSIGHTYSDVLRKCLEPIRKKIQVFHNSNLKGNIVHPKIEKITILIRKWLTSNPDCRIIVLIRRFYENLAPLLKTSIMLLEKVTVNVYPSVEHGRDVYVRTFNETNVMLAQQESVEIQSCPWEFFNHVIQFEFEESISLFEWIKSQNPRLESFVGLKMKELARDHVEYEHLLGNYVISISSELGIKKTYCIHIRIPAMFKVPIQAKC